MRPGQNIKLPPSITFTLHLCLVLVLGAPADEGVSKDAALAQMIDDLSRMALPDFNMQFDRSCEYVYQEHLYGLEGRPRAVPAEEAGAAGGGSWEDQSQPGGPRHYGPQWVLLNFDQPVTAPAVGQHQVLYTTCSAIKVWQPCTICFETDSTCRRSCFCSCYAGCPDHRSQV